MFFSVWKLLWFVFFYSLLWQSYYSTKMVNVPLHPSYSDPDLSVWQKVTRNRFRGNEYKNSPPQTKLQNLTRRNNNGLRNHSWNVPTPYYPGQTIQESQNQHPNILHQKLEKLLKFKLHQETQNLQILFW